MDNLNDKFVLMATDECGDDFRVTDDYFYFPTDFITDEEGFFTATFMVWEEEIASRYRGEYPEATNFHLENLSEQSRMAWAAARDWF